MDFCVGGDAAWEEFGIANYVVTTKVEAVAESLVVGLESVVLLVVGNY